jgi:steroid 5-alpha reductase family enzyme
MEAPALLLATLSALAAAMLALWLLSLALRDASIVDVFWGLGFVLVAWLGFGLADGHAPRRLLVAVLVTLWGVRLAGYLAWRNAGSGEDYRYRAMRRRHGGRFRWVSLFTVFGLQGVLLWVVSLPVQIAQASPLPERLTWLDLLGGGLWLAGFLFESIGDWQLARFKADPRNRGKVLDRGLWAWTRHPNYFGDFLVWWGLSAFALATPGGGWTLVGPLVMSVLLMKVSGVALLERGQLARKPDYADYVARTPAFFPRPPSR